MSHNGSKEEEEVNTGLKDNLLEANINLEKQKQIKLAWLKVDFMKASAGLLLSSD